MGLDSITAHTDVPMRAKLLLWGRCLHHCQEPWRPLLPTAAPQRSLAGDIVTPEQPSWAREGHFSGLGEHLLS